jgi:hypothetical protein
MVFVAVNRSHDVIVVVNLVYDRWRRTRRRRYAGGHLDRIVALAIDRSRHTRQSQLAVDSSRRWSSDRRGWIVLSDDGVLRPGFDM